MDGRSGSPALDAALRAIAQEDGARVLPHVEAVLLADLRRRRPEREAGVPKRPLRAGRAVGLALAASVTAALGALLWQAAKPLPHPQGSTSAQRLAAREIATAFMPLPYSAVPYTDGRIVRLRVPRASLARFGLAPVDRIDSNADETVTADVLVGEDGLARAIRFVRAPRAQGTTP